MHVVRRTRRDAPAGAELPPFAMPRAGRTAVQPAGGEGIVRFNAISPTPANAQRSFGGMLVAVLILQLALGAAAAVVVVRDQDELGHRAAHAAALEAQVGALRREVGNAQSALDAVALAAETRYYAVASSTELWLAGPRIGSRPLGAIAMLSDGRMMPVLFEPAAAGYRAPLAAGWPVPAVLSFSHDGRSEILAIVAETPWRSDDALPR